MAAKAETKMEPFVNEISLSLFHFAEIFSIAFIFSSEIAGFPKFILSFCNSSKHCGQLAKCSSINEELSLLQTLL